MTAVEMVSETESMFLDAASTALANDSGSVALDSLGFWDLLSDLDDPEVRVAVFAVFRAQGRTLASSLALGGLLAQPYLCHTAIGPGTVVAPAWWNSPRHGLRYVVVADIANRGLLFDRPGHGASLVERDAVELVPLAVPGMPDMCEVRIDWAATVTQTILAEADVAQARARSAFLGYVAVANELLGAAEVAVGLAVAYARNREQFGQPIGKFQAVRHLLAWAHTDCVAVEALARQLVTLDRAASPRLDQVLKALAGRNSRKACERALQVLGGIGFTQEHDHHRHHSRVLALDALLGSSATLTSELGKWLRETGTDPRFPASVLVPTFP